MNTRQKQKRAFSLIVILLFHILLIPALLLLPPLNRSLAHAQSPSPSSTPTSPPHWHPTPGLTWQIQFTGPPVLTPQTEVIEIDLDQTTTATIPNIVDHYHAQGIKVICYLSAGSFEDWREDAHQFPSALIGNAYQGWPGENWLDIRQIDQLAPIIQARLDKCAALGFDAVEFDNIQIADNNPGFPITAQEELIYAQWLAQQAHQRGLAVGQKNAAHLVPQLVSLYDFAIIEDAFYYHEQHAYLPYLDANKAVFAFEYTDNWPTQPTYCTHPQAENFSLLLKHRNLNAWQKPCP